MADNPQDKFRQAHPFLPKGWEPAAPNASKAPMDANGARDQFSRDHPFAPSGWADQAAARYTALHAETQKAPDKSGPGVFNAELEQIWAAIRRIDNGGNGGGSGTGITPPLYLAVSAANPTTKVQVKSGTVGGIIPTNVATDITVSGTDGTWYIFIDATIDSAGDVTAAAISSNTTGVTADSSTHAYYLVGTVTVASSVITAVTPTLMFSQEFAACGRDTADPSTTPGTYYFFVA